MSSAPTRPFTLALTVCAALSGLVYAHGHATLPIRALESMELQTLDWRFQARGARPVGEEVVLLAFDDRTLSERPDLFERRAGMAEVITAAHSAGAKAIGLDLLFTTPEQLLAADLDADIQAYLDAPPTDDAPPATPSEARAHVLLQRVNAETHGDEALADALKAAGNTVLGIHIGTRGDVPGDDRSLARGRFGQVTPGEFLPQSEDRVLASHARFNRSSARLGLITTFEDDSGSVRSVPLGISLGPGAVFAPMAVQLLAQLDGVDRSRVAFLGDTGVVQIGDRVLAPSGGHLSLNWRGEHAFPTHSVLDLVSGELPEGALRGRIAIIGFTHLAQDVVRTPWGPRPGFEVHATAVDNLLRGDSLQRASALTDALVALLGGALVCLLFLTRRLRPAGQLAGATIVTGGVMAGVHLAFSTLGLWVSAVGPAIVIAGTTAVALAAAYLREGRQRRFLRRSFGHYLSDDLVDELVADPSRVSLTGERRELTVLFSDIRDFTSFSEAIAPVELANFLNAYFTPMTGAVLDNRGYVDKFIGDAVMALFGAPVRDAAHAERACQAAIDMFHGLKTVQPIAQQLGIDLAIGAGINTGEMVVGNLGSAQRFDYTVLGDAVNLSSRLEGLTKRYGVFCLVGPDTAAQASPAFQFRAVDLVRVKGKAKPVEIFELCGGPAGQISAWTNIETFESALGAYRAGEFELARANFQAFARENPTDAVAQLYLDRLTHLSTAPEGWDGVTTFDKK